MSFKERGKIYFDHFTPLKGLVRLEFLIKKISLSRIYHKNMPSLR